MGEGEDREKTAGADRSAEGSSSATAQSGRSEGRAADERGGRPLFKKKRVIIPAVAFVGAVAVGVWYWYTYLRGYVSTDDAFIDADRVSVSAKILGRINRLTVDEGSRVKEGEVLVELDDADLKAQLQQARAGLAFAQDSLPLSKVHLDRAKDDFQRAEVQHKGAIITQEQYVHAQNALQAAEAEYAIAVSRIGVAKAQVGVIETQLGNTVLYAPFDGVVAKRWAVEGDIVQPGQPIFAIYETARVWVTANLEETKLGRVKLQDKVEVHVDTYSDRPFSGRVSIIGDYTASEFSLIPPNNASGNFTKVTQRVPLRIEFEGLTPQVRRDFPLRPGMSVEVKIRVY
jgi:membrane fusion protein (multidrug efflux system)